jgi:hypothetical protein
VPVCVPTILCEIFFFPLFKIATFSVFSTHTSLLSFRWYYSLWCQQPEFAPLVQKNLSARATSASLSDEATSSLIHYSLLRHHQKLKTSPLHPTISRVIASMHFDRMFARSIGDCPVGSTYYSCGGSLAFWTGCCSANGCSSADGCPADADISISIATNQPWPTFTTRASKVTSDVGAPITAGGTTSTITTDSAAGSTNSASTDIPTTGFTSTVNRPSDTAPSGGKITPGPQSTEDSTVGLPRSAIAGISVGGTVAVLILILVIFLFCRRRKHVQHIPSYNGNLQNECNEKSGTDDAPATTHGSGGDVFAPFGGIISPSLSVIQYTKTS